MPSIKFALGEKRSPLQIVGGSAHVALLHILFSLFRVVNFYT